MTQNEEVLGLLRERPDGVTPLTAFYEIGTMRLAARVYDLRAQGHDIEDRTVRVRARNGQVARVKSYRLR